MIPGIVASVSGITSGGVLPSGTVLDFVRGVYVVDGTAYAIGDLFEDGPDAGTAGIGTYQPERVVTGRGWAVQSIYENEMVAKGPLKDLLYAPHSGFIEWEDGDEFWNYAMGYAGTNLSGVLSYLDNTGSNNQSTVWTIGQATSPKSFYRWLGVNRLAWSLGVADTMVSVNGSAVGTTIDTESVFSLDHMTNAQKHVWPFGVDYHGGTMNGYIRKLVVQEPIAAAGLAALATIDVPSAIADIGATNIASTSFDLTFTPPAGATGYQTWIRTSSYPRPADDVWVDIGTNLTITGLTPSTAYRVYVRPYNDNGPGEVHWPRLNVTTTA
jgi:hypothetical protein